MSPTSYQTAPPRTLTIAEWATCVKSTWEEKNSVGYHVVRKDARKRLPRAIGGSVDRRSQIRVGMHVGYPGRDLVGAEHDVFEFWLPVLCVSHWIGWNFPQIGVLWIDKIFKRLRRGLFVERVLLNCLAHDLEVMLQLRFLRDEHGALIAPRGEAEQNDDDRNDDHQLQQSKAGKETAFRSSRAAHALPVSANSARYRPHVRFLTTPFIWFHRERWPGILN